MRRHALLAAASAAVISIAALASAGTASAEPSVIKIGSHTPPKASHIRVILQPWMKRIEKESGGTVKFQEFWGGQLIRQPNKQYEGMINGIQDSTPVLPSYTEALFPDFGLFSLPFLFHGTGSEESAAVGWKLHEKGLINGLDKVYVAAVYSNDNGGMHFNSAFKSFDDMHGKKVRAAGPGEADVIKAVGATPVSMSITQVAESLNRGVIDGTFNGWSALNTFRITPLIKTHVDMPFGVRAFFMAINKKVYDGLPAAARRAIDKNSGLEFSKAHGAHWAAEGLKVRKESEKDRIVLTPSREQLAAWSAKFRMFHDAWIKEQDAAHRRKLYDATMDILKALRASS